MWYTRDANSLTLFVYVQPGSKTTEIAGLFHEALKIKLNVAPIEGRANEALQKYMSQLFKVPMKQVTLVRGEKSRRKTIRITGSQVDPRMLL